MKRKAAGDYYFHILGFNKNIGIDKKVFEEYSNRIAYVDRFTEIMNDIYIITDIEEQDYIYLPKRGRSGFKTNLNMSS